MLKRGGKKSVTKTYVVLSNQCHPFYANGLSEKCSYVGPSTTLRDQVILNLYVELRSTE